MRKTIKELNARLAERTAYRNTLAPINRLPDVLFYTIFSFFQKECRIWPWKSLEWIRVTHVCREWRGITLDHAMLWTYIPFHRQQWIPELIKRSKSALLTFDIQKNDVIFDALKKLMRQHVSRLQVLKIHGGITERQLQELFNNLPAGSATHLQCLRLPSDAQSGAIITAVQRCLGSTFNLKELDVACSLDWTSKILTGLTHLILSRETRQPDGTSGVQDNFLSALQRMPFLRLLHLGEGCLPIPESSTSNPVNLPYLESLRLSDSSVRICNALRRITFPGIVQPRLHFKIVQLAEVKEIMQLLGAFKSADRPVIRRLKVRWEERRMQLTGWTSSPRSQEIENDEDEEDIFESEEIEEQEDEEDCYFQVEVSWSNQLRPGEEHKQAVLMAISRVLATSPVPPLTVLSLSAFEPIFDLGKYFKVLGRQPELHTILVEGKIFWPLLQSIALMSSPEKDPPNYPSLRHLNLRRVLFNPKGQHHPFYDLQGILEVRKKYGMRLRSIDFFECQFLSRAHISALKKTVDKVTWDEMEIGLSDYGDYEDEEDFEDESEYNLD